VGPIAQPSVGQQSGAGHRLSMSAADRGHPLEDVALRWHHLAERRLAYYTELFNTGRWRRYYADERIFALRMLDVIKAARAWARIAHRQSAAPEAVGSAEHDDLRPAA
jgi:uncharacterized repeat protein (TIGR03809 family)